MRDGTVVIIGGGLGGLFCGSILAKEGMRVTVVEKNATAGGGLQSFRRFGETFDTGMHVIGGMNPGGSIRKICDWLGITSEMMLRDVDDDRADSLYFAEDRQWYDIAKGKDGFVNSLAAYFPEERQGLTAYVDAVFRLTEVMNLFYLRPSDSGMNVRTGEFLMPADEFVAKYIGNRRLRSIVAYMNPLYGGRAHQTPAFVHAVITVLYINGAARFVGGSDRFANLLVEFIKEHGGEVITGDRVEKIISHDRHIDRVVTRSGRELRADWYISAIHPCTMLSLMDEHSLPKSYRMRLDSIPNSYSAFSLYIKMKANSFPYINHSEYYMTLYDEIWNFPGIGQDWPLGFLLMTPPEENQDDWSRKVLVTAPMSFEEVRQWEHTLTGRRGAAYEAWKEDRARRLIERIEEMHPHFADNIEKINTSSPLTIRDFYGAKEGGISGFSKDCNNIALSQVPVITKIDNLLLTGQNNSLHGFCGVPLTAITTCEAIFGKNYVLNQIASCTRS